MHEYGVRMGRENMNEWIYTYGDGMNARYNGVMDVWTKERMNERDKRI